MKLIKINTDHYIIVDDSEIKEGDWYLTFQNNEVIGEPRKCEDSSYSFIHCRKITHSTQPLENLNGTLGWKVIEILSLSEVKELLGEVDVERKAELYVWGRVYLTEQEKQQTEIAYMTGYNQALEDNKDKKYTEEDMMEAMLKICEYYADSVDSGGVLDGYKTANQIIQSLQPKAEWEVEFDENGKLKLV